jgi:hypothetical protein
MLVSGELYAALKEAGASDDKAEGAAAVLAAHETRLRRIETLGLEALRWGAIFVVSSICAGLIAVAVVG